MKPVNLTPDNLKKEIDAGDVVLVDIREPIEHAQERIPCAQHIPMGELDSDRLGGLGEETHVVLHCRTGRRSAEALNLLAKAGFPRVSHLEGGIEAWKSVGLETESTPGAPRFSIFQQVLMIAGGMVLVGTALGAFVHPAWLSLSVFAAAGQVFAGATGKCAMATVLGKMPWNKISVCATG